MDISSSISSRLSKHNTRIDDLIVKWYRTYLAFICMFALFGYAFTLLFPLLVILASINIYYSLLNSAVIDWTAVLIWSVVLIFAALLCYRITQFKPVQPTGLSITEEKAPEIYKLIEQLHAHFKRPKIHRVVITTEYELDVVKVPKWALPVWSTNTMIIGLPVLLCLSATQFECLMARRIGQFSKRHNPLTNWLYQLRGIWKLYSRAYEKQKYLDSKLLKWFYDAYAVLYTSVTAHVARVDELHADTYTTELYTDVDVREMITADCVYQWYLRDNYWPAVDRIALVEQKPSLTPYQTIASNIHASLKGEKLSTLINEIFQTDVSRKSSVASLRTRLENVGHAEPSMLRQSGAKSARNYLGDSLNSVIDLFDKLWMKNHMEKQKRSKNN